MFKYINLKPEADMLVLRQVDLFQRLQGNIIYSGIQGCQENLYTHMIGFCD